jgi:hypothetical protein
MTQKRQAPLLLRTRCHTVLGCPDTMAMRATMFGLWSKWYVSLPSVDFFLTLSRSSCCYQLEIVKVLRPSLALGEANQYHNIVGLQLCYRVLL